MTSTGTTVCRISRTAFVSSTSIVGSEPGLGGLSATMRVNEPNMARNYLSQISPASNYYPSAQRLFAKIPIERSICFDYDFTGDLLDTAVWEVIVVNSDAKY